MSNPFNDSFSIRSDLWLVCCSDGLEHHAVAVPAGPAGQQPAPGHHHVDQQRGRVQGSKYWNIRMFTFF